MQMGERKRKALSEREHASFRSAVVGGGGGGRRGAGGKEYGWEEATTKDEGHEDVADAGGGSGARGNRCRGPR